MEFFTGDWENDLYILYAYIDCLEFYTGTESKKMNKGDKTKDSGRMLYGSTWKRYLTKDKDGNKIYRPPDPKNPKLALTKVKYQNPILEDVFKEFSDLHFPDFIYDSVQLTKNFQIERHIDSKNVGESVLIALGDYVGGETCIEYEGDVLEVDCRQSPIIFNGSECYHWVKPFIGGDRYSIVFFNLYKK